MRRYLLLLLLAIPAVPQSDPNETHKVWLAMRDRMRAADAAIAFDEWMKDALVPPKGFWWGKLLAFDSATNPTRLVLALSDDHTPEITLVVEGRSVGKVKAGDIVEFNGVIRTYQAQPLMFTIYNDNEDHLAVFKQ